DGFHLVFHRCLAQLFKAALACYLPFYKCSIDGPLSCTGLLADPTQKDAAAAGLSLPAVGSVTVDAECWTARLTETPALLVTNQDRTTYPAPADVAHGEDEALRQSKLALLQEGHFPFGPEDSERYTPQELHYDRRHYVSF